MILLSNPGYRIMSLHAFVFIGVKRIPDFSPQSFHFCVNRSAMKYSVPPMINISPMCDTSPTITILVPRCGREGGATHFITSNQEIRQHNKVAAKIGCTFDNWQGFEI